MPWFASGYGAELPDNQIIDDSKSVVFDSANLKSDYVILGKTTLTIELSSGHLRVSIGPLKEVLPP